MGNSLDKPRYTFRKEERLCSKKLIAEIFDKGSSFNLYPLRFVYITSEAPSIEPTQVLISVSKKKYKRAADRNKLKRRIREAYRLNKHLLSNSEGVCVQYLAIIYIGKEIVPFNIVEKKLISGIKRLLNNR